MLKHVAFRSTSSLGGRASSDLNCRSASLTSDTMSLKGDLPSPELSLKCSSMMSQDTMSLKDAMSLKDDPLSDNISLKGDMSLKSFAHDNISLHSTVSFTSLATGRLSSRCSSTASLNEQQTTPVKVYLRSLRPDFEYKTMKLSSATTCRQLIVMLLTKFRLRHRDPNLFFVTMEVTVRASGGGPPTRRLLVLDDQARPAELQQCRPRGDARFSIGVRRGGLLRIHDSILMQGSQYKSLLVSFRTTAEELVQLLLNCYGNKESHLHYAVHEVNKNPYTDRPLRPDECPLSVQSEWPRASRQNYAFVLRRNVAYALSLKSRISWRRSLDQSSTDTESEHEDHNTTITSLISTSSVSSALSISSDGSLSSNGSVTSSGSLSSEVSVSSNASSSSGVSSSSSMMASPCVSPVKKPPKQPITPESPVTPPTPPTPPPRPPSKPTIATPTSSMPSNIPTMPSTPCTAPTPVPRTILNTLSKTPLSARPLPPVPTSDESPSVSTPLASSSTSSLASLSSSSCNSTTTISTSTPKSSTESCKSSSTTSSSVTSTTSSSSSATQQNSSSSTTESVSIQEVTSVSKSPPPPPVPLRRSSCCPNYENCFYI